MKSFSAEQLVAVPSFVSAILRNFLVMTLYGYLTIICLT